MNGNLVSPPPRIYLGQPSTPPLPGYLGTSHNAPHFIPGPRHNNSPTNYPGHPTGFSRPAHFSKAQPRVWHPLRPGRFDQKEREWKEVNSIPAKDMNVHKRALTIVTYNVLFDLYKPELLHTELRVPAICELLRSADADIIGLEEVTQSFLLYLLAQDWVKESYYVSDSGAGETVQPYGQVILSRIPFYNLVAHQFSLYKMFVVGEFLINGRKVCVPVVHLTSDRAKDCSRHRASQLQIIYDRLDKDSNDSTDCFLLGDFNMNVGETVRTDFEDAWELLRPDEVGHTFDINVNATAALMARDDDNPSPSSTSSQRFDRVLLRSVGGYWKPRSIEMFGTEPIVWQQGDGGMQLSTFPSDHFGLRCVLEFIDEGDRQIEQPKQAPVPVVGQPLIHIQPPLALQSRPASPQRADASSPHGQMHIHGHVFVPHAHPHSHPHAHPHLHPHPHSHNQHYRPRGHNNHSYKAYPQLQGHAPSYGHGPSSSTHSPSHYSRSRSRYHYNG